MPWLALLVWLTIAVPIAQKGVVEQECDRYGCDLEGSRLVSYRLLSLSDHFEPDDPVLIEPIMPAEGTMRWYDEEIPHDAGRTPLLAGGFIALLAAPWAAIAMRRHLRDPTPRRERHAWIAYGVFSASALAVPLGIIVHAATWTGIEVSWLTPHLGAILIAVSLSSAWPLYEARVVPGTALPPLPESHP